MATNKKRQQTPPKPQGKCVFCNGHGMTKQHVWPNWINREKDVFLSGLPKDQQHYYQNLTRVSTLTNIANKTLHTRLHEPQSIKRLGLPSARKLRMVCNKCNNGWMSQIEEASKPLLLRLQNPDPVALTPEEWAKVVAWIAQMTIIVEFTDIPTKAIPISERQYFHQMKMPPLPWCIWVGRYEGQEWILRFRHHGHKWAAFEDEPSETEVAAIMPTNQFTSFALGKLFVVVMSAENVDIQGYIAAMTLPKMVRVWPLTDNPIDWTSMEVLSDADAKRLADDPAREVQLLLQEAILSKIPAKSPDVE